MRGPMSFQTQAELPAEDRGWRNALKPLANIQYRWLYGSNLAFFFAIGFQTWLLKQRHGKGKKL